MQPVGNPNTSLSCSSSSSVAELTFQGISCSTYSTVLTMCRDNLPLSCCAIVGSSCEQWTGLHMGWPRWFSDWQKGWREFPRLAWQQHRGKCSKSVSFLHKWWGDYRIRCCACVGWVKLGWWIRRWAAKCSGSHVVWRVERGSVLLCLRRLGLFKRSCGHGVQKEEVNKQIYEEIINNNKIFIF